MGLSLRNIGSRVWDQVNPFDAGLSATTRQVDPNRAKMGVVKQARDIFDANSQEDQRKRVQSGMPRYYKDEQRLTRRDNVQSVAENPFQRIWEEATEAPRRIGLGLSSTSKTGGDVQDALLAEQQYTQDNELKAVQKIKDPNTSYAEKVRWYNYLEKTGAVNQQRQADIRRELGMLKNDADPVAMTAAIGEMGLDVATLGAGGLVFKGTKQAIKQGVKQGAKISAKEARKQGLKAGTKFVGKNIIKPTAISATGGGLGAVTAQGSDVTAQQIGLGAGAGAAFGAALPLAGLSLDKGVRTFGKGVKMADDTLSTLNNPAAKALQDDYVALNTRWQTATPKMRKNIEKSIKLNREEFARVTQVGAVGKDVRPDAPEVSKTELGENIAQTKTVDNFNNRNMESVDGETTELVPVDELFKYAEFDRKTSPMMSAKQYQELKADIAKNGIKEPLLLNYGAKDRIAVLGEGNHRLAIARELGMTDIPVRVTGTQANIKGQRGKGFGRVKGTEPDRFGYVPSNQKPSDIGIKTAQPKTPQVSKEVFKDTTGIPQTDRILRNEDTVAGGKKIADYYRSAKGEDWKVLEMTPEEYLRRDYDIVYDGLSETKRKVSFEEWLKTVDVDQKKIDKFAADMKNGTKYDMPTLNHEALAQDGRHRIFAARKNGAKKVNVAVAEKFDPTKTPQVVRQEKWQGK